MFNIEKWEHFVDGPTLIVMCNLISQSLYQEVMGVNPSFFKGDDKPVESISWYEALRFANALSLCCGFDPVYQIDSQHVTCFWGKNGWRLPTATEWMYLARGGESYLYAGSDNVNEVAWVDTNSAGESHLLAQKKANGFGLYDMSGNVCEWTFSSESTLMKNSNVIRKIVCGGSWFLDEHCALISEKISYPPQQKSNFIGYRLIRINK